MHQWPRSAELESAIVEWRWCWKIVHDSALRLTGAESAEGALRFVLEFVLEVYYSVTPGLEDWASMVASCSSGL